MVTASKQTASTTADIKSQFMILPDWRPMLCPERNKIRLSFHKCLGSRRPMLCPERNEIRFGVHKCLGPQVAHIVLHKLEIAVSSNSKTNR